MDWIRAYDAARVLGIKRNTFMNWVKRGYVEIRTKIINGVTHYNKEDIENARIK